MSQERNKMSKTGKTLIIVTLIVVVLSIGLLAAAVIFSEAYGGTKIAKNNILVLEISGPLNDYAPKDPMASFLGIDQPDSFSELLSQLRHAKNDSRIGGVMLHIDFTGIGWGKADELRDAIKDFRKSGKPAYAYIEFGMNKEYYIATAAEKIFVPPAGDLFVNGFSATAMFYRGTLEKIGIEPDVVQIGKYKSAPESYTRKDMSEGQREVTNAIVDQYYENLVNAVAKTRNRTPEDVKSIIDNAPYHSNQAKEVGLTDEAIYKHDAFIKLGKKLGLDESKELPTISGAEYGEIIDESTNTALGERIAIVYVTGTINFGESSSGGFSGAIAGSDTIVDAVNAASKDTTIKAIVLRVDSPGGSSLASDLMWNAIERAKAEKPVVVSMGDVAASGGYYISCGANSIVAEPNTLTGSIGVFMGKPVLKGFYEWAGVTTETIQRGKNSGIFRVDEKWTEEERAKMEGQAQQVYFTDFLPKVAKGRNMNVEKVDSLGQGHVWTGTQAKQNGLVDEIGGLETAIGIAKKLAEIPDDEEVTRVPYPSPGSFFESYFSLINSSDPVKTEESKIMASLPKEFRRTFQVAALFDQMRKGDAMLLLPFELEIK